MSCTFVRTLFLAVTVAAVGTVLAPAVAQADASCTAMLTGKYNYLIAHDGGYVFELTRTDDGAPGNVTYSRGELGIAGLELHDPGSSYLFSDRHDGYSNGQRFSIYGAETIQVWISQSGALWIYNNDYGYYILNNADMSCVGNTMTKYVNGAVYTLAFREYFNIF